MLNMVSQDTPICCDSDTVADAGATLLFFTMIIFSPLSTPCRYAIRYYAYTPQIFMLLPLFYDYHAAHAACRHAAATMPSIDTLMLLR